jgi:hypothetical protein
MSFINRSFHRQLNDIINIILTKAQQIAFLMTKNNKSQH